MWMFGSRTTVKKVRNSLTWFQCNPGGELGGVSSGHLEGGPEESFKVILRGLEVTLKYSNRGLKVTLRGGLSFVFCSGTSSTRS